MRNKGRVWQGMVERRTGFRQSEKIKRWRRTGYGRVYIGTKRIRQD